MSIEQNKKDFERELELLEILAHDLQDILCEHALKVLNNVAHEYNTHFKDDIQELIDEADDSSEG